MFCTNCGKQLKGGAKFCPYCGQKQKERTPLQETVEVAPEIEPEQVIEPVPGPAVPEVTAEAPLPVPEETIPKPVFEEKPSQAEKRPTYQAPLRWENTEESSVPVNDNVQKKWPWKLISILAAVGLVVITAVSIFFSIYNAPIRKFERALNSADYSAAAVYYGNGSLSSGEQANADKRIEDLVTQAVEDYNASIASYESVSEWLKQMSGSFGELKSVSAAQVTLNELKASKDQFQQAASAETSGDIAAAIEHYSNVSEQDTQYTSAQEKASALKETYKTEIITQAKKLADSGDYAGACAVLKECQSQIGEDADIAQLIEEYTGGIRNNDIKASLSEAEEKAQSGDYLAAIDLLKKTDELYKPDSQVTAKLAEYKQRYKEQILTEATNLAELREYQEAVARLTAATTVLGDTEELLVKIQEYEDCYPVALGDMDYYAKDNYVDIVEGTYDTDVLGNTYSGKIICPDGDGLNSEQATKEEDGEIEYLLNGEYKTLSGTLYVPYISRAVENPEVPSLFKVYGDGKLLYTAPDFRKGVIDPVEINVDISGVKVLKISILGIWFENIGWVGYYGKNPMICAADLTVSKG